MEEVIKKVKEIINTDDNYIKLRPLSDETLTKAIVICCFVLIEIISKGEKNEIFKIK